MKFCLRGLVYRASLFYWLNRSIIIHLQSISEEKCLSGRKSTPGKCVYAKSVSRVRISPSPLIFKHQISKACNQTIAGFFCELMCYFMNDLAYSAKSFSESKSKNNTGTGHVPVYMRSTVSGQLSETTASRVIIRLVRGYSFVALIPEIFS